MAGGSLLALAACLSPARAQTPPPRPADVESLVEAAAAAAPAPVQQARVQTKPFPPPPAKLPSPKRDAPARLPLPVTPSGTRIYWEQPAGAAADEDGDGPAAASSDASEFAGAAEAHLLFLYTLEPETRRDWLPDTRVNVFAEETPSSAEALDTLWRLQAKSNGPEGGTSRLRLLGEGESALAFPSPSAPEDALAPQTRPQLLLVDAEQRIGNSRYGAAYRYDGPGRRSGRKYPGWVQSDVKWKHDQESAEAWFIQRFGDTQVRAFLAEFQNNLDANPSRYSIDSQNAGVSVSQRLAKSPLYLTVSGSQGASRASREPNGREPFSPRSWNTYNASLSYFPGGRWDAYISTGYSTAGDLTQSGDPGSSVWHEAGVSIHPVSDVTIKPALALGKIRNERTGGEIDYPFASLSLSFRELLPPFDVTLWTSYARMTSGDSAVDATLADASIRLSRRLPGAPGQAALSFEVSWTWYEDHAFPSRSNEGASAMTFLRLAF